MMNDRFSAELREHLHATADERPAEGRFAAIVQGVAATAQRPSALAWLTSFPRRLGPFPSATVRYGLIVLALIIAAVAAVGFASGQPRRSEDLGIFAPVAGRIAFENEAEMGDLGYDLGLWAIDPTGPSDTAAGPSVAAGVASTLVRLDLEKATPLGWSSDGTELLFSRPDAASAESLFPKGNLYILHADGSETRLNRDPMMFGGATISPDGTRVAFAASGADLGLWVVDAEGGRPVRVPLPGAEGIVANPTFSPDGTQIAYVDSGSESHLWVMDADGGHAREILAKELTLAGGGGSLQWSPTGDRLAIQVRAPDPDGTNAIYTFAPDGSDFRRIITGGLSPYWSPDGSQIAYTIECELSDASCGGLAIANADGSNVREFGFGASGPWHPGPLVIDADAPASASPVAPSEAAPSVEPAGARELPEGSLLLWNGEPDGVSITVRIPGGRLVRQAGTGLSRIATAPIHPVSG